jgi:hypothetical protein
MQRLYNLGNVYCAHDLLPSWHQPNARASHFRLEGEGPWFRSSAIGAAFLNSLSVLHRITLRDHFRAPEAAAGIPRDAKNN